MNKIKTLKEIEKIKVAGRVVAKVLSILYKLIDVDVTGLELDEVAKKIILANNCQPNFLGYHRFPNTICVSINEQIVHGIPNNYRFKTGDIIKIDVGCQYQGYHADAALTKIIGKGTALDRHLVATTYQSLQHIINNFKPYMRVGDLGFMLNKMIQKAGFFVTKEYAGHGIGQELHEDPIIYNFGVPHTGIMLKPNMVFCVEPMVLIKSDVTVVEDDGWTVRSLNRHNTAHFEHTLLLTDQKIEILTPWEELVNYHNDN